MSRNVRIAIGVVAGLLVLALLCVGLVFVGQQLIARPAAPAAPVQQSVVVVAYDCGSGPNFVVQPGETKFVKSGCRISGDVAVSDSQSGDFTPLYDNEGSTGLVVDMQKDGWVFAQWGASVNSDSTDQWVENMKLAGCEGKCLTVNVEAWR